MLYRPAYSCSVVFDLPPQASTAGDPKCGLRAPKKTALNMGQFAESGSCLARFVYGLDVMIGAFILRMASRIVVVASIAFEKMSCQLHDKKTDGVYLKRMTADPAKCNTDWHGSAEWRICTPETD